MTEAKLSIAIKELNPTIIGIVIITVIAIAIAAIITPQETLPFPLILISSYFKSS